MAVKIYSETFLVLYNVIEASLRKRRDPAGITRYRKNDRSIWEKECPIEKIPLYKVVFPTGTYPFYFNEKKSSHKNSVEGYLYEPTGLMYDAFQYLGYKLDEKISVQITDEDLEVRVLYQFFLRDHCKKFYQDHIDELRIYDEETGTILKKLSQLIDLESNGKGSIFLSQVVEALSETNNAGADENIRPEKSAQSGEGDSISNNSDENSAVIDNRFECPTKDELLIEEIKQVVERYIECITIKDFDGVFSLFSKGQKKKMGNYPKYISELFRYTLSISGVNIFNIGRSNTFEYAEALVYYEERKDVLTLIDASEYDDIFTSNVDNIHLLKDEYKKFEKKLDKNGMAWAGRLKVEHLFREDFISYLWAKSLYDPSDIERIFSDERKQKDFHRLYKFIFEKTNDCWLIANIISINAPAFIDEFKLYLINQYRPLNDSMPKRIVQIFADITRKILNRVLG